MPIEHPHHYYEQQKYDRRRRRRQLGFPYPHELGRIFATALLLLTRSRGSTARLSRLVGRRWWWVLPAQVRRAAMVLRRGLIYMQMMMGPHRFSAGGLPPPARGIFAHAVTRYPPRAAASLSGPPADSRGYLPREIHGRNDRMRSASLKSPGAEAPSRERQRWGTARLSRLVGRR